MKSEGERSGGLRIGPWRMWYRDGTPKKVVTYLSGKLDGSCRIYDEEGQLWKSRSGQFHEGQKVSDFED